MIDLEVLIKDKGITKVELAERLGIARPSLYSILNGNPTVATLERVAEVIGCEMADFFPRETVLSTSVLTCPHCGKKISLHVCKRN